jgi:cytochrome c oxidase cbb3-type subunit 1
MAEAGTKPEPDAVALAVRHALAWLVFGNAVGVWLALLLVWPDLQAGEWTYGRWVPVHLNVQLYGWTSLPLLAWLFHIYEVDRSKVAAWAPAAVWAWSAALALAVPHWLNGQTSGKIFLDWCGGPLWGWVAALSGLWLLLALAWWQRAAGWSRWRQAGSLLGVVVLAAVPAAMVFAASPAVYPQVDATTGGPTGSSLLGSTLVVVTLMMLLPRAGAASGKGRAGWGVWTYLLNCWLVFGTAEWIGGTHLQFHQIGAMAMLLPWAWIVPWDWAGFGWLAESRVWRRALFAWWGLLALTGVLMYLPGLLDRLKFTQGLVGHAHLAMAGYTTSFCALLMVSLTGRAVGGRGTVAAWHVAVLVMISVLAAMGWREGGEYSWMVVAPGWRTAGLILRAACGMVLLCVSMSWFKNWKCA